jgi:RTX calcium-binding nonapeptide repeat (4 copies)
MSLPDSPSPLKPKKLHRIWAAVEQLEQRCLLSAINLTAPLAVDKGEIDTAGDIGESITTLSAASPYAMNPNRVPYGGHGAYKDIDFNGDGYDDIVVAEHATDSVAVVLNGANGTGQFLAPTFLNVVDVAGDAVAPDCVAIGRFFGDAGFPDIVTGNNDGSVDVFIGEGDGQFEAPKVTQATLVAGIPTYLPIINIAIGDVDIQPYQISSVTVAGTSVMIPVSNGGRYTGNDIIACTGDNDVFVDLNPMDLPQFVIGDIPGKKYGGSFYNKTSKLTYQVLELNTKNYGIAGDPVTPVVGDFNNTNFYGEPLYSIAVADPGNNTVGVLLQNAPTRNGNPPPLLLAAAAVFGGETTIATKAGPDALAVTDLLGDGDPKLVVGCTSGYITDIPENAAGNGFGAAINYNAGIVSVGIAVTDINDDTLPDFVDVGTGGNVAVLDGANAPNQPAGATLRFDPPIVFPAGEGASGLALGDFLGPDSQESLIVANNNDQCSELLNGVPNGSSISFVDGTVHVNGVGDDEIVMSTITIDTPNQETDVAQEDLYILVNGELAQTYPLATVDKGNVQLEGGDDLLEIEAGVPPVKSVSSGEGSDTVIANNGGFDSIQGGSGNDFISDLNGTGDQLTGGAGNNTIIGGTGIETLRSGHGNSEIINGACAGGEVMTGAGLTIAQFNPNMTVTGVPVIIDPPVNNNVGNPLPAGGAALAISLNGTILTIVGQDGGNNILVKLVGSQYDVFSGGISVATFPMQSVTGIIINGGEGSDTLGIDPSVVLPATIKGNTGSDSITGGGGGNLIIGGGGNDTLVGGAGISVLIPNRRLFSSTFGDDSLVGGAGFTIADFAYRTDNLVLSNNGDPDSGDVTAGETTTIANSIKAIWGGAGNDTITGVGGGNLLSGGGGDNSITGGGSDDTLLGGSGFDTVVATGNGVAIGIATGLGSEYSGTNATDFLQINSLDTPAP